MERHELAGFLRNGGSFYKGDKQGLGSVDPTTSELVVQQYGKSEALPTQKGEWRLHYREGFILPYFLNEQREPKDGFCAIYWRNGAPRTLVLGEEASPGEIDATLKVLTERILEQTSFSWPPKKLAMADAKDYGFFRGSTLTIVAGLGLLIDAGVGLYASGSPQMEYTSLVQQYSNFIDSFDKDSWQRVFAVLGIPAAGITTLAGPAYIAKGLGKAADRKRVSELPFGAPAMGFFYGAEAAQAIQDEHATVLREQDKEAKYKKLLVEHGGITKQTFAEIYDAMNRENKNAAHQMQTMMDELSPESKEIPLEKIIRVLS